mmetsp:Transcript_35288/g.89882  ORF Transcript_35288/g.89882 Transcript_35288/m.89882 type:complete len:297 (+) Transcript_35288:557-1447(+)
MCRCIEAERVFEVVRPIRIPMPLRVTEGERILKHVKDLPIEQGANTKIFLRLVLGQVPPAFALPYQRLLQHLTSQFSHAGQSKNCAVVQMQWRQRAAMFMLHGRPVRAHVVDGEARAPRVDGRHEPAQGVPEHAPHGLEDHLPRPSVRGELPENAAVCEVLLLRRCGAIWPGRAVCHSLAHGRAPVFTHSLRRQWVEPLSIEALQQLLRFAWGLDRSLVLRDLERGLGLATAAWMRLQRLLQVGDRRNPARRSGQRRWVRRDPEQAALQIAALRQRMQCGFALDCVHEHRREEQEN